MIKKSVLFLFICLTILAAAPVKNYKLEVITDKLNYPWSTAILPNGDILITEKPGSIRIVRNGKLLTKKIQGVPKVAYKGQGGLHEIMLHPNFKKNRLVYLSYAAKKGVLNTLKVSRYQLEKDKLSNATDIFETKPGRLTAYHYGGRLLFLPDGSLLISHGDAYIHKDKAQTLNNHFGKIVHLNADGSIPKKNPFLKNKKALPGIWSYGHRNPQGLVLDPRDGTVYAHEHGPKGGDELNIIEKGKNYGWPEITFGIDYNGSIISEFTEKPGMEQPIRYWVPSIALSSMSFYDKNMFPTWKNSLFITGLVSKNVYRLKIQDKKITEEEILFAEINDRLRDITTGPDGSLYILTDSKEGRLIRVSPK